MPKLKITKTFPFAHRGCEVVTYQAGTEIDTDDQDLIDTILTEKWGHRPRNRSGSKPDGTSQTEGDDADDERSNASEGDGGAVESTAADPTTPAAE